LQLEYLSAIFENVFGQKRDDALWGDSLKGWLELIVSEYRKRALAGIGWLLSGERVAFEHRIKRPSDGEICGLRCTIFPLLDRRVCCRRCCPARPSGLRVGN
jgi:hypothetical protein